jgi:glycosyltransferase involved in cell wall biosynthesis
MARATLPRSVLLFAMYEPGPLASAPQVRISMMAAALGRLVPVERVEGSRRGRTAAGLRWLLKGGWRRVGAVYVESSTSSATPFDLAFLGLMRLLGRPVGIYFRDAYQLFRSTYPITRRRQRLADWLWRVTMPLMRRVATHRFTPSAGLARVLGVREPILLPSGTDPGAPDLGPGDEPLVAYVGSLGWADGYDRLIEAMRLVRERVPSARLCVIGPAPRGKVLSETPGWLEMHHAGRDQIPELVRGARVCVIPRPITEYTNLAVPVKLWDYLSYGKPVVATATTETKAVLDESEAGIVTGDQPEALAAGIVTLLRDETRAGLLARRARAFALSPGATWDARAGTVVSALLGQPGA